MSLGHTLAYSSASPRSLHQPSSASCADVFLVLLHPHLAEDPKLLALSHPPLCHNASSVRPSLHNAVDLQKRGHMLRGGWREEGENVGWNHTAPQPAGTQVLVWCADYTGVLKKRQERGRDEERDCRWADSAWRGTTTGRHGVLWDRTTQRRNQRGPRCLFGVQTTPVS